MDICVSESGSNTRKRHLHTACEDTRDVPERRRFRSTISSPHRRSLLRVEEQCAKEAVVDYDQLAEDSDHINTKHVCQRDDDPL